MYACVDVPAPEAGKEKTDKEKAADAAAIPSVYLISNVNYFGDNVRDPCFTQSCM